MYDPATVLTIGLGFIVPAVPVIWKSSDLRGDLDNKWAERVDIASAGLTERAIVLLRRLQIQTDEVLGDVDNFDPDLITADPGPLASITGNFQKTIRTRDHLSARLRVLLALGLLAPILTIVYIVGVILNILFYTGRWEPPSQPAAGYWIASTAIALGLILVLTKFYLEQKLVTAEIMSRPAAKLNPNKKRKFWRVWR